MAFEGRVQLADLTGVVLIVVDLHGPRIDVRLECTEVVGQIRRLVSHCVVSWLESAREKPQRAGDVPIAAAARLKEPLGAWVPPRSTVIRYGCSSSLGWTDNVTTSPHFRVNRGAGLEDQHSGV